MKTGGYPCEHGYYGLCTQCVREERDELRTRVAELERERDVFKRDYHEACMCVADMHRAAVGQITGPRRGVVEDVEDIHHMAECTAIMAVCGYFSRMRGPDVWLHAGSWDEYPELFACAGVDLRSFQHGTRFYAGSAPVPAAPAEAKAADDVARYRWLRNAVSTSGYDQTGFVDLMDSVDDLEGEAFATAFDAAIDKMLAAKAKGE